MFQERACTRHVIDLYVVYTVNRDVDFDNACWIIAGTVITPMSAKQYHLICFLAGSFIDKPILEGE